MCDMTSVLNPIYRPKRKHGRKKQRESSSRILEADTSQSMVAVLAKTATGRLAQPGDDRIAHLESLARNARSPGIQELWSVFKDAPFTGIVLHRHFKPDIQVFAKAIVELRSRDSFARYAGGMIAGPEWGMKMDLDAVVSYQQSYAANERSVWMPDVAHQVGMGDADDAHGVDELASVPNRQTQDRSTTTTSNSHETDPCCTRHAAGVRPSTAARPRGIEASNGATAWHRLPGKPSVQLHVDRPGNERILVVSPAGQQADSSLGFTCRHGAAWPLVTHVANAWQVQSDESYRRRYDSMDPLQDVMKTMTLGPPGSRQDPLLAAGLLESARTRAMATWLPPLHGSLQLQLQRLPQNEDGLYGVVLAECTSSSIPQYAKQLGHTLDGRTSKPLRDCRERLAIEAAGLGKVFQLEAAALKAYAMWYCDTHRSFLNCTDVCARAWVDDVCSRDFSLSRLEPPTVERTRTYNLANICNNAFNMNTHGFPMIQVVGYMMQTSGGLRVQLAAPVYRLFRSKADLHNAMTLALYAVAEVPLTRTERGPLKVSDSGRIMYMALPCLCQAFDFDTEFRPLMYVHEPGTDDAYGLGGTPKLVPEMQAACPWATEENGDAVPLTTYFDCAHAVRLLFGAQQSCIARAVGKIRAAARETERTEEGAAHLSRDVETPNWLQMLAISNVQTLLHPGTLPATAAARLLAQAALQIPNSVLRNEQAQAMLVWERASHHNSDTASGLLRKAFDAPLHRMWYHVLQWIAAHAAGSEEASIASADLAQMVQEGKGREECKQWIKMQRAGAGNAVPKKTRKRTGRARKKTAAISCLEAVMHLGPKMPYTIEHATDGDAASAATAAGTAQGHDSPDPLSQLLAMPTCAMEAQPWIAAIELHAAALLRGIPQQHLPPVPAAVSMLLHSGRTWPRRAPRLPLAYNPVGLPDLGTAGMRGLGARPVFHSGPVSGQLVEDQETVGRAL